MHSRLLYLFTRTPLHVGAGSSVGAIDQPIQRERHTQFPVVPGSALKGVFADTCNETRTAKRKDKDGTDREVTEIVRSADGRWLFGEGGDGDEFAAGALQFSEARLLAFPVRSAKGSFAWLTSPLALARATRDGVPGTKTLDDATLKNLTDETALFIKSVKDTAGKEIAGTLALGDKVVLEEYTFAHCGEPSNGIGAALKDLIPFDDVWKQVTQRLVIVSDGMLSFFAKNACEVAQHVAIDDCTGTAANRKLFNQENVPSETLFYAVVTCFDGRGEFAKGKPGEKKAADAETKFREKIGEDGTGVFQFGGDASTGLGYCTVRLAEPDKNAVAGKSAKAA